MTQSPLTTTDDTMPDRRGGRTPRDMALSLLVLLVPVVLILALYRGLHGGDTPVTADPAPAVSRAAQVGLTAAPRDLPPGWKVATARFDGRTNTLRLGYLTEAEQGLQLVVAKRDGLAQEELTRAGTQTGVVSVGGDEWQVWSGRPDENALVTYRAGISIVIVGQVPRDELVRLAEHLPA